MPPGVIARGTLVLLLKDSVEGDAHARVYLAVDLLHHLSEGLPVEVARCLPARGPIPRVREETKKIVRTQRKRNIQRRARAH